jgi:hypothetical protein
MMSWIPEHIEKLELDPNSCVEIDVPSPPCGACKWWQPRKSSIEEFLGYRFCWLPETSSVTKRFGQAMQKDFSCFEEKPQ